MKRDSEIIRDLISLAFDTDPEQSDITLIECLGLYERSLRRERELEDLRLAEFREEFGVDNSPDPESKPEPEVPGQDKPPEEHGRGKAEKQSIYNRLKAYRDANGLGCLNDVAAATAGKVDADMLRAMLQGQKVELKVWRQVAAALDKLVPQA